MAPQNVLILGCRIDIQKYHEFFEKTLPENLESFVPLDNNKILRVRENDEKLSFYFADQVFELGEFRALNAEEIQRLNSIGGANVFYNKAFCSKYGFHLNTRVADSDGYRYCESCAN